MYNNLKPYEEYQFSEASYIQHYPKHWNTIKLRFVFEERKEKNKGIKTKNILSVMKNKGVIPYSEKGNVGNKHSEDIERYNIVHEDDIVMNCMNVIIGSVGRSKYYGALSPVYYVLKNRDSKKYNVKYFEYMFKMNTLQRELTKYGKGILAHRMRIPMEMLKNLELLYPPKDEQDQIVKYLDSKLAKINKFIKAKRRLITVLKEQKQAVINQAVTKGLNPNVKMKPSGIEWLGDIPEHWECGKLKRYAKVNPPRSNAIKQYSIDDNVVFLSMERISVYGDIDNSEKRPIKEVKDGFTYFEKNDVVVAKITPCFENGKGACLDNLESEIGFGTTELIVLRAKNNMLPKYLYFITRTSYFRKLGTEVMTGAAGQKRVPPDFISNFVIGVPDINEQQVIVEHILKQLEIIDNRIEIVEKEIDLITEYRTRLISDVVTGKIDVRGIEIEDIPEQDTELDDVDEELEEYEEAFDAEGCEL